MSLICHTDAVALLWLIVRRPGWMVRRDHAHMIRRMAIRIITDPLRALAAEFERTPARRTP